jgi:hypothetical protein
MKTITKKQIKIELRTLNTTNIFKIAKLAGIDVKNRASLYKFIIDNAPSNKVFNSAFNLSYGANYPKQWVFTKNTTSKISKAIRYAMQQKKAGKSPYSKILVVGNSNIYWASPVYLHQDYNKSIALENNEKNRKLALTINKYLNF